MLRKRYLLTASIYQVSLGLYGETDNEDAFWWNVRENVDEKCKITLKIHPDAIPVVST